MDLREDKAQITEVLVRYATGIDRRDWDLFGTCFTPDVEVDYDSMEALADLRGAGALTAVMARAHEAMGPTFHRMTNVTIEVADDVATARSYVHAVLMVSAEDPGAWVDVVGWYEDDLVRTEDGWRIARRVSRTARMLTSGPMPGAGS